jgi:hypothetical protein
MWPYVTTGQPPLGGDPEGRCTNPLIVVVRPSMAVEE